jgi:hypothetical protein
VLILDKLAERTADIMAGTVSLMQSLRPVHPRVWLGVLLRRGVSRLKGLVVSALKRVLPMFPWGARQPRSAKDYFISSARLARGSFILGARVTPIVWRMSQDSRSRDVLALIARIIFGRPDRRPRRH